MATIHPISDMSICRTTPSTESKTFTTCSSSLTMVLTHDPRLEITMWFIWNFISINYDMYYTNLRPHSLPGHKWHAPFKPLGQWAAIDNLYGERAWIENDTILAGVTSISGFEAMLCLVYLWSLVRGRGSSKATKTNTVRPMTTHTAVIGLMVAVAHWTKMWMYSKFVP
jgi:hypothetical protein